MIIRDVNNYIAIYEDGTLKTKATVWYDLPVDLTFIINWDESLRHSASKVSLIFTLLMRTSCATLAITYLGGNYYKLTQTVSLYDILGYTQVLFNTSWMSGS
jgi:hypothetical protein